jgi:MoxR-like ATPase
MRSGPPVQTTVPEGDDPRRREIQLPSWALVLVWSSVEPQRVGEVAFLPADGPSRPPSRRERHRQGARGQRHPSRLAIRRGPLVSHNCGVATDTLNESKLFGNVVDYPERGTVARPGLLGRAAGGTLFLDELGDFPLDVQTMLLRAFDSGEYEPQGADAPRRIKFRVIGATNRPQSMLRGDFRYRFNHPIHLPPLRDRREDIPLLIRHWFRTCLEDYPQMVRRFIQKCPTGSLEPRLNERLVDYILRDRLNGNVRELNEIVWLALRGSAGDELEIPESMPEWQSRLAAPDAGPESDEEESDAEDEGRADPTKDEVHAALEAEPKNFSAAARKLGWGRKALTRLMAKYGRRRTTGEGLRGCRVRDSGGRNSHSGAILLTMMTVRARVKNGRLILDEPTDLPEGTEVELAPVDDEPWELTAEQRAELEARMADKSPRLVPAAEVVARVRGA